MLWTCITEGEMRKTAYCLSQYKNKRESHLISKGYIQNQQKDVTCGTARRSAWDSLLLDMVDIKYVQLQKMSR